jgi:3-hydroxymyristoyl/3-hydroxydecanoyl-(acyl carrier protein) dehydratase
MIATKSELISVMLSVIGSHFMNAPMMPGQKISGAKAATVVAVDVITGQATSAVPRRAASRRRPVCW